MNRLMALALCFALLLTGCGTASAPSAIPQETTGTSTEGNGPLSSGMPTVSAANAEMPNDVVLVDPIEHIEFTYVGLNDEFLSRQIEDLIYAEAVSALDSTEYVVESVQAQYISKEYIEEVMFNSQSNVYFGYTLDELNDLFQGRRYVFTLGEDGQTTVKLLEEVEDTTYQTAIKNVLIGSGVILVCVTVSCVTAGAAPAASVIFAASAKTGAIMATSAGGFGAVTAGIVRGIETGDMKEAVKAAALAGSEGFKWGAISGAIVGGGKEAFALKKATKGGLTMNEVAIIQRESKLPMDIIGQFHSFAEYNVYKEAELRTFMVNGKTALIQSIDLNYISELPDGTKVTNLVRMQRGLAPIDPATGRAYELHHIGQSNTGSLAVLTQEQHRGKGIFKVLHHIWDDSGVDHGSDWANTVKAFWKYLGNQYALGVV